MRKVSRLALTLASTLVTLALTVTGGSTASAAMPEAEFIVQVPDGDIGALRAALGDMDEHPLNEYESGIDAALVKLNDAEAQRLQSELPDAAIGLNHTYRLSDVTQTSPPWHLKALNETETAGVPTTYRYPNDNGQDVDVFIIDTGIDISTYNISGKQLYGKVRTGRNFVVDQPGAAAWASATNADDCWVEADEPGYPSVHYWGGHGTHVAGIVASNTYGVAKNASVIPLRVFGCPERTPDGEGTGHFVWEATTTTDHILDALDWAIDNKRAGIPAVVNMSLGGEHTAGDDALNNAVQAVIDAGISVVSAAGNSASDACDVDPASAPNGITVGAINSNYTFASYSNYDVPGGSTCVSVLAPGTNIRSLAAWDSAGYLTQSGTSMATPVVSGIAALYLAKNPNATPAQVKSAILSNAVEYLTLDAPGDTTSLVVNSLWLLDVRVSQVDGLVRGNKTTTRVALSWNAASAENDEGPTSITDYSIQYKRRYQTTWRTAAHSTPLGGTTSFTVKNLTPGILYDFRVAAIAGITYGEYSSSVGAKTLTGITSAVTNLRPGTVVRTYAGLKWDLPLSLNGGVISDYVILYRPGGTTTWQRYYDAVTTTRTVKIGNLRPGKLYFVRVYAKTQYGLSPYAERAVRTDP